ncbi:MAG: hypothetical protein JXA71_08205, partial [Chitinispirillaceae bacterium]|nr:hypothetical protein [Chitinispirillaceae bacterium]
MRHHISKKVFRIAGIPLLLLPGFLFALDDRVQDLPAMGWNSWNYYHCTINEATILGQAVAMARTSTTANWEGRRISMKDVGYKFVNLDDCWEGARTNRILDYDHTKFPKGFPWLCDTIRKLGLLPGLYTSAGTGTCQRFPAQYGYDWEDAF